MADRAATDFICFDLIWVRKEKKSAGSLLLWLYFIVRRAKRSLSELVYIATEIFSSEKLATIARPFNSRWTTCR